MKSVPLFKSNYSIGRSILTLAKPQSSDEVNNGSRSVFEIAKDNGLKEVVVVDDSFGGAIEGFENAKKLGIKLIFGVRLYVTDTLNPEDPMFPNQRSKIVLLCKNKKGYDLLSKIWTFAAVDGGIKGVPHLSYELLNDLVTDDIFLMIPFYDSFIYKNLFYGGLIVPNFKTKPKFCLEDKELPFDNFLRESVKRYCESTGHDTINVSSIYYEKREDFLAYLTFRCITERTTLDKPEFNAMSSDGFSFEDWKLKNQ